MGAGGWVADRIAMTASTETDYYIPHAHNIYAQTAAEHGVIGVVAGAIAIACLAWLIRDGLRDTDTVRRRWAWAALFGTIYFGAHQLLDFYANFPAMLFAFALPVAWLDATAARSVTAGLPRLRISEPHATGWARRARRGRTVLVIAGRRAARPGGARQGDEPAGGCRVRGDWAAALPLLRAAHDADPEMPAYTFERGSRPRTGAPGNALASLETVANSDDLPVAWLDVAALRQDAGDAPAPGTRWTGRFVSAPSSPASCLPRVPSWSGPATPTGRTSMGGRPASLPSLAGDPWWLDPVRAARWPGIRDAALAGMGPEAGSRPLALVRRPDRGGQRGAEITDPAAASRPARDRGLGRHPGGPRSHGRVRARPPVRPRRPHLGRPGGRSSRRPGTGSAYRLWALPCSGGASLTVGGPRRAGRPRPPSLGF